MLLADDLIIALLASSVQKSTMICFEQLMCKVSALVCISIKEHLNRELLSSPNNTFIGTKPHLRNKNHWESTSLWFLNNAFQANSCRWTGFCIGLTKPTTPHSGQEREASKRMPAWDGHTSQDMDTPTTTSTYPEKEISSLCVHNIDGNSCTAAGIPWSTPSPWHELKMLAAFLSQSGSNVSFHTILQADMPRRVQKMDR